MAGLAVLTTACGNKVMTQDSLDPQGPVARKLDNLINPVFIVAGLVFVFVEVLIVVTVLKWRRRSEDDRPKQVHGNTRLELTWTVIPALILLFVALFTVRTIFEINKRPAGDALPVTVTGHQWWWEYQYPDLNVTTANELHIPIGRPVDISLTSVDVIHNFWPPKLAGKVYAIPGRMNHMVIQADEPGVYYGQCSEFCGLSHANMRLRVVAHTEGDFSAWARANDTVKPVATPVSGDAAAGADLFKAKGCASCHSVSGYSAGTVGPNLTHLRQRSVFAGSIFDLDDVNLRKWLRDPPAEKPGSIMPNLHLSEDEITKLIAYLNTLK